jgi:hypothetical protein
MSWSSRLLRGSLATGSIDGVGVDFTMLALLALAALVLASAFMSRILRTARQTGELALR